MAINRWWDSDPKEQFWMEITTREDTGTDLNAPKTDQSGGTTPGYELVSHVNEGDVVFHYQSNNKPPAIVGFSIATSSPSTITGYHWQSRGAYAKPETGQVTRDGWLVELGGMQELPEPLELPEIASKAVEILDTRQQMQSAVKGALYFPFSPYGETIRAAQQYLAKFPAQLIELFPQLQTEAAASASVTAGTGNESDPVRRKAIEMYAVNIAIEHYVAEGYTVKDVGAYESWDLEVSTPGDSRHVEVKGSTVERLTVDLTHTEVAAAGAHPTDLFVVDRIAIDSDNHCWGGRKRLWPDWVPAAESLLATAYRHTLGSKTSAQQIRES